MEQQPQRVSHKIVVDELTQSVLQEWVEFPASAMGADLLRLLGKRMQDAQNDAMVENDKEERLIQIGRFREARDIINTINTFARLGVQTQ